MPLFSDTELAYAAGLFDGEGCIDIRRIERKSAASRSPSFQLRCSVAMTHLPTIELLFNSFGGALMHQRERTPYKQLFTWRITDTLCKPFLEAVYPFLKTKKYEAWLALEYEASKTKSVNRKLQLTQEEIALREGFYWALKAAKTEVNLGI